MKDDNTNGTLRKLLWALCGVLGVLLFSVLSYIWMDLVSTVRAIDTEQSRRAEVLIEQKAEFRLFEDKLKQFGERLQEVNTKLTTLFARVDKLEKTKAGEQY